MTVDDLKRLQKNADDVFEESTRHAERLRKAGADPELPALLERNFTLQARLAAVVEAIIREQLK